jgi:DNA mismatch endonuclease Vsr
LSFWGGGTIHLWDFYFTFANPNMSDIHSPATRSYNMSRIKGKDTKPEMMVRKFLFSKGFRYRLHDKKLPGKPDIVLPKYKTVIFVNGCFWHGHEGCKYFVLLRQIRIYSSMLKTSISAFRIFSITSILTMPKRLTILSSETDRI